MKTTPLYSIGTWDAELQAFTPQDGLQAYTPGAGLGELAFNLTLHQLRCAMRGLRAMGYACRRRRTSEPGMALEYDDNDTDVLIERTDGKPEAEILQGWER